MQIYSIRALKYELIPIHHLTVSVLLLSAETKSATEISLFLNTLACCGLSQEHKLKPGDKLVDMKVLSLTLIVL